MARTVFISYASEDAGVAETICSYLEAHGIACWIAPRNVRPGREYAAEIIAGIESSAALVLVLTAQSNASPFVSREVERAVSKGIPVYPVRAEAVIPAGSLELFVSSAHWIDAWEPPLEAHLARLAEALGQSPERQTPAPPRPPAPSRNQARERRLGVIAVALAGVVGLVALLLQRGPDPSPEQVAASPGTTAPVYVDSVPTAGVPAPAGPDVGAGESSAPPVAAAEGLDPCPVRLNINRDLPTPYTCQCRPEAMREGAVWGTDFYTDDSGLCQAAQHAGVITAAGGRITVLRVAGRPLYHGSSRNGVRSSDYGAFDPAIRFAGAPTPAPGPEPCPVRLNINRDLPTPHTCHCGPEAVREGAVWGTDTYTDDSGLCRAALHAGVIPPAGGTVTVTRVPGRPIYTGSRRNGVASSDYGAYDYSMRFQAVAGR